MVAVLVVLAVLVMLAMLLDAAAAIWPQSCCNRELAGWRVFAVAGVDVDDMSSYPENPDRPGERSGAVGVLRCARTSRQGVGGRYGIDVRRIDIQVND